MNILQINYSNIYPNGNPHQVAIMEKIAFGRGMISIVRAKVVLQTLAKPLPNANQDN